MSTLTHRYRSIKCSLCCSWNHQAIVGVCGTSGSCCSIATTNVILNWLKSRKIIFTRGTALFYLNTTHRSSLSSKLNVCLSICTPADSTHATLPANANQLILVCQVPSIPGIVVEGLNMRGSTSREVLGASCRWQ